MAILQIIRPATPEDMAGTGATGGQFRPIAEQLAGTTGWVVIFDGEPKAAAQIMANWNKAKKHLKTIEVCKVRGTGRVIARLINVDAHVADAARAAKAAVAARAAADLQSVPGPWSTLTPKQRTARFIDAWNQTGGSYDKTAELLGIPTQEAIAIAKQLRTAGHIA